MCRFEVELRERIAEWKSLKSPNTEEMAVSQRRYRSWSTVVNWAQRVKILGTERRLLDVEFE